MSYRVFIFACLLGVSWTLQVAPSSPCSSLCIDNSRDDASLASSSSTEVEDITCLNSNYASTAVGTKFQGCLSCLQTSSYSSGGESDQAWFLYNLRFAVDTCLFGSANSTNTNNTLGGPCLTSSACKPLQSTFDGSLDPAGATFDYCTADGGIFTPDNAEPCSQCLHDETDISYLSNFVVALSAGCQQRPGTGTVIGLNQTVFSTTLVAVTNAVRPNTSSKSGLPMGAKIGIIVGGVAVVLMVVGISIVCFKKRQARRAAANADCDPRFGAPNITAPQAQAFSSPLFFPGSGDKGKNQSTKGFTIHPNESEDLEKSALTDLKLSRHASNETQFSSVSYRTAQLSPQLSPRPTHPTAQPGSPSPPLTGQRSPNPPPSLNQWSPNPPPSFNQRSPNPPPSLNQRSPNPPPSLNQRSPNPPPSLNQRSPSSFSQRSPPPPFIFKRSATPGAGQTGYVPAHSPAYTFNGTSPQNSPPMVPPPRSISSLGLRRAPTPLGSHTQYSRDESGPRTGGSSKSNATVGVGSPATSPRAVPKSGPNSPQHPQIMHISPPQPQTLTRAETAYNRDSVQSPLDIDTQIAEPIQPSLQSHYQAQAEAMVSAQEKPPRSESRAGTRLLTRLPSVLMKTSAGKEAKKTWSPDSPSPVEQWPGSM